MKDNFNELYKHIYSYYYQTDSENEKKYELSEIKYKIENLHYYYTNTHFKSLLSDSE